MHCAVRINDGEEALLSYCAGKLDRDARTSMESHLAGCAECRSVVEGQSAVWRALDTWQPMPVTAGFNRRLYARIEQKEKGAWWGRLLRPGRFSVRRALPVGAACAAAIAIVLLRPVSLPDPPPQVRIEAMEIEQVEQALEDLEMLKQLTI